jgi:hypothetical protein
MSQGLQGQPPPGPRDHPLGSTVDWWTLGVERIYGRGKDGDRATTVEDEQSWRGGGVTSSDLV